MTELAEPLGSGEGLMFVAGEVLRYQAPATATTVRAIFVVRDATGNETAAAVTIQVHASDAATKSPPRPQTLVARVFAGDTVRIPVPLVGIDDDGDGLTLLGIDSAGSKGQVTAVGADYLEYQALAGESGTDTFTYAVEDWTGQRAVATVRVGIAARPADSNRVVARDDTATVRPGQTVEVRVLANDVDMSGGDLTLAGVLEVPAGATASAAGNRVVVSAVAAGVYPIGYTAANSRGARADAVLTVTVDGDAPVRAPVAQDVVVPPVDTVGRTSVDVDVLAVAQNPSGPVGDLTVSVPSSAADVAAVRGGVVTVTLTDRAQTVPYLLTNSTDTSARSYAFITVPALGFFPPTARPHAAELRVASGEPITISLDEQVQVAPGRTATIADAGAVTANRSDGSALVVDGSTLRFTSAAGYAGPASITVPVTDATGPDDTSARTSVITLPITVYTEDDYPPVFVPSVLSVAPGEPAVSVDLRAFTAGVEGAAGSQQDYRFQLTSGVPAGFTATLDGTRLSVSSAAGTPKGSRATLQLTLGYGRSGSMDVQVEVRTIASTRRVATVVSREIADGVQGAQTVVDVLSGAYNPFPDVPLRVVGVSVETPGAGTASVSGSSVVLRPAADLVGTMVVRVRVHDATDDSSREVAATLTLRVRGTPATPTAPRVGEVRDGTVVLSWTAPDNRGEPITGYRVTAQPGGQQTACASTTCTITGLTNDVEYTFTVAAKNAVGWSDPSPASASARPDAVPDAPAAPVLGWGDGQVTATWSVPAGAGSPITSYTVQLSPAPPGGGGTVTGVIGTSITFTGLENGTEYTVQVRAHNRAAQPSAWSPSSDRAAPAAPPDAPTPVAERVDTALGGQIAVRWDAPSRNGADLTAYRLVITGGGSTRTVDLGGAATGYTLTDATNGTPYTVQLTAANKAGWSAAGTGQATAFGLPATPTITGQSTSEAEAAGAGWARIAWSPPAGNGSPVDGYEVRRDGAAAVAATEPAFTATGLVGGTAVLLEVRAHNAAGWSGWTGATLTPVTLPGAVDPASVTATVTSYQDRQPVQVSLGWAAVATGGGDRLSYAVVVEQQTSGGWVQVHAGSVTATSTLVDVSGIAEGVPVRVRVTASTSVGAGGTAERSAVLDWLPATDT
ncbi:MAG TPA: fibronectin type III domain-containing protein [Cellulomonas sp.]